MASPTRRVAIVGGGIAGMACSWELRKHDCSVDMYESASRLGGHANSVPFEGNGASVDVDTGFIAMDEPTYPQFTAFLGQLGVATMPTDMSFGVSTADGAFEWSSRSVWSFVGTPSRLLKPWFWRLMLDVMRFSLFARDILDESRDGESSGNETDAIEGHLETIGHYLTRQGYSEQFMTLFLMPMVAAPWCIDPDDFAANFPAKPLVHFMAKHGLLDTVTKRLRWRSFRNGSKTYVDAFRRSLPPRHRLHLSTPVHGVARGGKGVLLSFADGSRQAYDHVVLAVHANQALALMGGDATGLERRILGAFKTSRNVCYLHSDTRHLPKCRRARSAWNCFLEPNKLVQDDKLQDDKLVQDKPCSSKTISITFDMNKLQAIPLPGEPGSPGRVLVTMNPTRCPRSVQSSHVYYHPLISSESVLMTRHMHSINGVAAISFAGAWMGLGFHEDGFAAGVHAARVLVNGRDKTCPLDLIPDAKSDSLTRVGLVRALLRLGVVIVLRLLQLLE
ncbi:amine oxidase [Ophiocordyceps sinensis CO18]|uniref:Amine oxidase n=1 Tax=Ophiocordyceps sinensis (strain Co18 / CGMCC 3.14243) TaxID=911162 RepID=T5AP60_OPHSC|nr:amine oxidase [Ophiocordyceps sinensis CO18]